MEDLQIHNLQEELLPGSRRIIKDEHASTSDDSLLEKHGDVILVPQPTQSPNDPLNWSLARKIWHTLLVCYITALTAGTANTAGAAAVGVNEEYGISYDVFNTGAGILFIGIGYWTLLASPGSHLYGRRIAYLVSCVWGIIGNFWFGRLQNKNDTIWTQLFVGASEAVGEAAVQLSLLDIWFEHQNGTSLGLYTLATSLGTYIGPLLGGHIASSSLGWRWIGYWGGIASVITLAIFYFGLEETSFPRDRYLSLQSQVIDDSPADPTAVPHAADGTVEAAPPSTAAQYPDEKNVGSNPIATAQRRISVSFSQRKTYWQRIAVITPAPNLRGWGFKQYGKRLWSTLRIFTFPACIYAGLQWGMQNVCLSYYLTVQEDHWIGPPWYYSDAAVANMNLACLIGSVIGCFYGGYLSDKFQIWMSRRNNGIMEAEFRLALMVPCALIFPAGMLLFGIGSEHGWAWPVPYVGLGFIGFGYGCAGDLSITYLADAYPDMILEGMVGVAVINNTLAMIFTFAASGWLDSGIQNCFIALAVISFVVMILSAPMMYWGKSIRRWTRPMYTNYLHLRDGMDQ
ncbi:MFS general substrate transporter [Aaosphaeria arxii CBS 175.79]|uniref:MFS general substrate transporter n=1 Tax=Aaosphaeria arxii CBS 175.79 TaxID=1450172 RepID=A0A6A5XQH1_9PLEO|nr:MFS general substrate transporter [Aaosphaeria arxii CBS 175.79]KAF2015412.1 MFS general substrate transporter [Aaosphaeria arxii CBS 175.79]